MSTLPLLPVTSAQVQASGDLGESNGLMKAMVALFLMLQAENQLQVSIAGLEGTLTDIQANESAMQEKTLEADAQAVQNADKDHVQQAVQKYNADAQWYQAIGSMLSSPVQLIQGTASNVPQTTKSIYDEAQAPIGVGAFVANLIAH